MPGLTLILRSLAFLLLFASVMTIIAGTSSAQRREAAEGEAAPPQDTVVVASIGDLATTARFEHRGSSGGLLDEHLSQGPSARIAVRMITVSIIRAPGDAGRWVARKRML